MHFLATCGKIGIQIDSENLRYCAVGTMPFKEAKKMKSYASTLKSVKESINNGSFSFPVHNKLDYTGIGFGYNLKESYPKTMKEAKKDMQTPYFDKLVSEIF